MKRFISAAAIGMAALSPVLMQQKTPMTTVFIADGGRAYSGQPVQNGKRQPPSPSTTPSSSSTQQPKPATDPVGSAVKAGSDLLGVFGR